MITVVGGCCHQSSRKYSIRLKWAGREPLPPRYCCKTWTCTIVPPIHALLIPRESITLVHGQVPESSPSFGAYLYFGSCIDKTTSIHTYERLPEYLSRNSRKLCAAACAFSTRDSAYDGIWACPNPTGVEGSRWLFFIT